jgi:hypothetical protein
MAYTAEARAAALHSDDQSGYTLQRPCVLGRPGTAVLKPRSPLRSGTIRAAPTVAPPACSVKKSSKVAGAPHVNSPGS